MINQVESHWHATSALSNVTCGLQSSFFTSSTRCVYHHDRWLIESPRWVSPRINHIHMHVHYSYPQPGRAV